MTTTDRPQRIALELQARARDHALADRVDGLERSLARVHSRIDGAMVTILPAVRARPGARSSPPG